MHVMMLSPSLSRDAGGIFEIERSLTLALHDLSDVTVEVLGLRDSHTEIDRAAWAPIFPTVFDVCGPRAFGYAPDLPDALDAADPDVVHLHAMWMYTSVASLQWSRRTGRPHLVTINGMLDPWAVNNSGWKKKLAGWAYEHANLREAACLQVNTEDELRSVRDYGIDTPACIIPNGVDLPNASVDRTAPWADVIAPEQNVLLFLGRLHPKKGLSELFEAWKQWRTTAPEAASEWALAVIGWDDGGHEARLRAQVREEGLSDSVHFLGPRFGEEKAAAFSEADAFVLPSYSEGFPMAVLEAWSYGLPVLKTPLCNIPEGFSEGAALKIKPEAASIAEGLDALLGGTTDQRRAMGRRGRALVEERFTWDRVARSIRAVYRWILGDAPAPDCVVFS